MDQEIRVEAEVGSHATHLNDPATGAVTPQVLGSAGL